MFGQWARRCHTPLHTAGVRLHRLSPRRRRSWCNIVDEVVLPLPPENLSKKICRADQSFSQAPHLSCLYWPEHAGAGRERQTDRPKFRQDCLLARHRGLLIPLGFSDRIPSLSHPVCCRHEPHRAVSCPLWQSPCRGTWGRGRFLVPGGSTLAGSRLRARRPTLDTLQMPSPRHGPDCALDPGLSAACDHARREHAASSRADGAGGGSSRQPTAQPARPGRPDTTRRIAPPRGASPRTCTANSLSRW